MKKIILFLIVFATVISYFACKRDFLDKKPLNNADISVFETATGLKLAVNGIYDVFQGDMWGGSLYYMSPHFDAISEDATLCCAWEGQIQTLAKGDISPSSGGIVNYFWSFGYKGVSRANSVLVNIDKAGKELGADEKTQIEAEVKFLRGLLYFNLVTYYGDVPLLLAPITIDSSKLLKRTPKAEVLKLILSDLDFAANNLKPTPRNDELGRPTKQAALGLSSRVLLYQNSWAEAAAQAKKAMGLEASGAVILDPDYAGLFDGSSTNKKSKEILFSVQFKGASASTADVKEGNILNTIYGPRQVQYGGGWGSIGYNQSMFNAFYMIDGKPITTSPLYDKANPYANRDPRLYGSFFVPNISKWLGKPYTKDNYASSNYDFPLNTKKWVSPTDLNNGNAGDANYIILRYADVLLMYAEAQNEAVGADASVYEAINKIRGRVSMPPVEAGLSQADMRKVIQHERKVEFSQEGLRYFDLLRWGLAKEKINSNERDARNWKDHNRLLPIPQSERDANPNLAQNPGYPE